MVEHYGTAILGRLKVKAIMKGSVGVTSAWIPAALHICQSLSLMEPN